MELGQFNENINPKTYKKEQNYKLEDYHHVIVVRNRIDRGDTKALRLRIGRVGYSQWLNELQVYLLPNFKHENILPFLGYDKRYLVDDDDLFTSLNTLRDDDKEDSYHSRNATTDSDSDDTSDSEIRERRKYKWPTCKIPIEYYILNDFSNSITLRHFIMMHTLDWAQMIRLASGIANGLLYLHEHENWLDDVDEQLAAEGFVSATDGAIKTIYFKPPTRGVLRVAPPYHLTIVHRNLSSLNIVLRNNLTPCIWNFGTSHVYHPFQPINYINYIDKPIYNIHQNSVYSPPEVITKSSVYTLAAMKAVDMYAAGIVLWEMISRCTLPPIEGESSEENLDRQDPQSYDVPYKRELLTDSPTSNLLYKNVVERHLRPKIRPSWMIGKKSARFVKTICDLWDGDFDARIQARTLVERLAMMSRNSRSDKRAKIVWSPPDPKPITILQLTAHELHARPRIGRSGFEDISSDPLDVDLGAGRRINLPWLLSRIHRFPGQQLDPSAEQPSPNTGPTRQYSNS